MLEEGVAAVGDLRIRGAEAPGRGFAGLELAGDDPAVLDVVGEFAGLLDHPPLEMHTLFLSDDGGVLEGAGRLLQVDAARLGAQLVRAEVDEQVPARLHPAEFHVIGQPVGLDAGHGFGLGDGFLRFVGRLLRLAEESAPAGVLGVFLDPGDGFLFLEDDVALGDYARRVLVPGDLVRGDLPLPGIHRGGRQVARGQQQRKEEEENGKDR